MPEYECEDENVKKEMWEARVGGEEREGPRIHLLLVGPAPEMFGLIETIFFQWL